MAFSGGNNCVRRNNANEIGICSRFGGGKDVQSADEDATTVQFSGGCGSSSTSLLGLYLDQFIQITNFLELRDVFGISLTSRRMRHCCEQCSIVDTGQVPFQSHHIKALVSRFGVVKSLRIRKAENLEPYGLIDLANLGICEGLTELYLGGVRILNNFTFHTLASKLVSIRSLHFMSGVCFASSLGLSTLAHTAKDLIHLTLSGFRLLTEDDAKLLLKHLPNLQTLCLMDCSRIGTLCMSSTSLKSLDVSRCINLGAVSHIKLPCLTRLDASWCSNLDDSDLMSILRQCHALEDLTLRGCGNIIAPKLDEIPDLNLKSLNLSMCRNLQSVSISCAHLMSFDASMSLKLKLLVLDLPAIEELDLCMLHLENLWLSCPSLKVLNIRNNHKLSIDSIHSYCPSLIQVDICGTQISGSTFLCHDEEEGVPQLHVLYCPVTTQTSFPVPSCQVPH